MQNEQRWTAEEDAQLLEELKTEHPRVIAKKHQRTTIAIVARASRLRQATALLEFPMEPRVDEKYYEVVKPATSAERLLILARDQIYKDFLARMSPTPASTILDVGVSDVISDGANVLERSYPHLNKVTACGIGEARDFGKAFPAVGYIQIEPNARLPFEDGRFDIATANAVLEHVGSHENQVYFVSELMRVAKSVFVSVPHRFFPIEHHTAIPLLHYTDRSFRVACAVTGKSTWAESENLILMTRKKLWRLVGNIERNVAVGYSGLKMGPLSSNLFLSIT
ncbi:methyltransferase domain-containing protein [Tardiphaga sp. 862_B3_N4_1]|uniref:class I SAM-dependent methyltransferase n=1 Tax=Tardiphaga sp. 862_B3_N4_1 TaxID=3240764 RepID=UPI003F23699A